MSFGFSVGDFVLLVQLARTAFRNCRQAGDEYVEIATEVKCLHSVLRILRTEAENPVSTIFQPNSASRAQLFETADGCRNVLTSLDTLLSKYEGLGPNGQVSTSQRLRQKMGFGSKISELGIIRGKLIIYTSTMSVLIDTMQLQRTDRTETKVDRGFVDVKMELRTQFDVLRKEIYNLASQKRADERSEAATSTLSLSTYAGDEKNVWRDFRRELIAKGYRSDSLERHKYVLQSYMTKLDQSGILNLDRENQPPDSTSWWTRRINLETSDNLAEIVSRPIGDPAPKANPTPDTDPRPAKGGTEVFKGAQSVTGAQPIISPGPVKPPATSLRAAAEVARTQRRKDASDVASALLQGSVIPIDDMALSFVADFYLSMVEKLEEPVQKLLFQELALMTLSIKHVKQYSTNLQSEESSSDLEVSACSIPSEQLYFSVIYPTASRQRKGRLRPAATISVEEDQSTLESLHHPDSGSFDATFLNYIVGGSEGDREPLSEWPSALYSNGEDGERVYILDLLWEFGTMENPPAHPPETWTRISRHLVCPDALLAGREVFVTTKYDVTVLGSLTKNEIERYTWETAKLSKRSTRLTRGRDESDLSQDYPFSYRPSQVSSHHQRGRTFDYIDQRRIIEMFIFHIIMKRRYRDMPELMGGPGWTQM